MNNAGERRMKTRREMAGLNKVWGVLADEGVPVTRYQIRKVVAFGPRTRCTTLVPIPSLRPILSIPSPLAVCTENLIRVDGLTESPKLAQ